MTRSGGNFSDFEGSNSLGRPAMSGQVQRTRVSSIVSVSYKNIFHQHASKLLRRRCLSSTSSCIPPPEKSTWTGHNGSRCRLRRNCWPLSRPRTWSMESCLGWSLYASCFVSERIIPLYKFLSHSRKGRDIKWTHEEGSELMFDALVDENHIPLPPEDRAFIKALIAGEHSRTYVPVFCCSFPRIDWKFSSPQEKEFLFDIVANKRNGLDVDKWVPIGDHCLRVF